MAAFETELLRGLAQLMAANTAARVPLSYREHPDPYQADEVPITLRMYPAGFPRAVTLATYPVSDHPSLSDSVIGVQATLRAHGGDGLDDMQGDLFDLLHGRGAGMLGTVKMVKATRASGTSVGQDTEEREARTENYYLDVWRPSPHRT